MRPPRSHQLPEGVDSSLGSAAPARAGAEPAPPSLAVIVVNYRTAELTIACLRSLRDELEPDQQVVVVDNDSRDGSAALIHQAIEDEGWGSWARLLCSPRNGGFSAGNNFALRRTAAECYLLLNSDAQVAPGSLAALREVLRRRPEVGIVGPRLHSPAGATQVSCFRDHSLWGELLQAAGAGTLNRLLAESVVPMLPPPGHSVEAAWLSFACVMLRRAVLDQIGLLDEGYFMYFEDVDLCRRARAAGWKIVYCPEAQVLHHEGASHPLQRYPASFHASRARYFTKFHGGSPGLLAANACWATGTAIAALRGLLGYPKHEPRSTLADILQHW